MAAGFPPPGAPPFPAGGQALPFPLNHENYGNWTELIGTTMNQLRQEMNGSPDAATFRHPQYLNELGAELSKVTCLIGVGQSGKPLRENIIWRVLTYEKIAGCLGIDQIGQIGGVEEVGVLARLLKGKVNTNTPAEQPGVTWSFETFDHWERKLLRKSDEIQAELGQITNPQRLEVMKVLNLLYRQGETDRTLRDPADVTDDMVYRLLAYEKIRGKCIEHDEIRHAFTAERARFLGALLSHIH